jgi:hypothetical protein
VESHRIQLSGARGRFRFDTSFTLACERGINLQGRQVTIL